MSVPRRTVEDMEERFAEEMGNARARIEDLENDLSDARRERDEALKEQAELEDRVKELERGVGDARSALAGL